MLTAFTHRHFNIPAVWKKPEIISTLLEMRCRLHRLFRVQRYNQLNFLYGVESFSTMRTTINNSRFFNEGWWQYFLRFYHTSISAALARLNSYDNF